MDVPIVQQKPAVIQPSTSTVTKKTAAKFTAATKKDPSPRKATPKKAAVQKGISFTMKRGEPKKSEKPVE